MVGWSPSSQPVELPQKTKAPPKLIRPPVFVDDEEVPPSPREVVPHRSAGYGTFFSFVVRPSLGPAHQKRKLSVPDRSRSASPHKQPSPTDFDRYAKYERNRKGWDEYELVWVLAEETVTLIRIVEEEYYLVC